ncbi:carbohydrate ABC transporter permease [Mesorhizobium sp. BR1-1-16]|uniref:carbohydrate ABC transporter permease n=1 Tax=Mesorhizobium sp. BR1-1-16 TaxID=2876653 RepID=UPI001CCFC2A7|nr:carbohydrate ABC transporter permease [Mesorhizobium sp. BR1-1-16]MBZ9938137.1 carbohydrate ABC transporter permease [Mesorhizobium sp. BR1-1-16]
MRLAQKRSERIGLWLVSAFMLILAASTIYPIFFTISTALKSTREFIRHGFSIPTAPTFEKFVTAWTTIKLDAYFMNSAIVTVIGVTLVLLVSSLAGYALAQMRFRFRKAIYFFLLSGLMIPVQVVMVPLFRIIVELGMLNSRVGLGILYGAFFSPFGIYLTSSYFASIPRELSEAAKVDGASYWQIYRLIMLPLARPVLITLGILTTLSCWNDVLLSLLVLQDDRTLMVGIASLRGEYGADIPLVAACVVIGAAPVIAIFLIFQKKILGGIMVGSVKG